MASKEVLCRGRIPVVGDVVELSWPGKDEIRRAIRAMVLYESKSLSGHPQIHVIAIKTVHDPEAAWPVGEKSWWTIMPASRDWAIVTMVESYAGQVGPE